MTPGINAMHLISYLTGLLAVSLPFGLMADMPLFDTHLHYSEDDTRLYTHPLVIQKLDKNEVRYAAVTGTPASYVSALYHYAPDRIVPILSVYRNAREKESWTSDTSVPEYVDKKLDNGYWQGIGELHIFACDRHSDVFKKIIQMASQRQIPLLLHADPAVIDTLYEISPKQSVIWAHASTFPYPDLIADYLQRYPMLQVDLSKRDHRIAPQGELGDDWYDLFVTYPDRFMVGVDTYSTERWHEFDAVNNKMRHWLKQLPEDVARKLAYDNAVKLFLEKD